MTRSCRSGFSPTLLLFSCLLLALPLATFAATPVHQLRIYEIFDHNKQAFHDRFRDHAMRIMKRYDFDIVAMWEAKNGERTEFVYLLEWPDEATIRTAGRSSWPTRSGRGVKKETAAKHGQLVGEIQDRSTGVGVLLAAVGTRDKRSAARTFRPSVGISALAWDD